MEFGHDSCTNMAISLTTDKEIQQEFEKLLRI